MAEPISLRELTGAIEKALVESYDAELKSHRLAQRFKWLSAALFGGAAACWIFHFSQVGNILGVFSGFSVFAWVVSHAEWVAKHQQIGILHRRLSEVRIFVGGRGREVRLTTNPYDNEWGYAVGAWLRSPLPDEKNTGS